MKTKAMKGISHRILTLALALLMALSTLSGALSVSALGDDEEIFEAEEPGPIVNVGEE